MVRNGKLLVVGLMAAVLALFGASLSASASHVAPTLITGNPTCEGAIKIEPVQSGSYGPLGSQVHIVVSGSSFSFWTDDPVVVSDVIVKGGNNANWYHYDPATNMDTGLTAPLNPKTGRPYGLSHLCFSVDDKKVVDPK